MLSFPDQLLFAISQNLKVKAEFRQVCICGMGGSAIGGDIISDYSFALSQRPVFVIRGVQLPDWVCQDTLVLVCSYSGNTQETMQLFNQALSRGCPIFGISSGGTLEKNCANHGLVHIKVPGGLQPRCALGFMVGFLGNVLDTVGLHGFKLEITRCVPLLQELRNELGPDNPHSLVRELALRNQNNIPVIYSYTYMASSALRWKNQVNENSKSLAFSGTMPEFNHNEVVGWVEGVKGSNCVPIFLYDPHATPLLKNMMDVSLKTLRDNGITYELVVISGETVMEKNLRAVMYADLYSLYLAFLKNVDPTPVRSITTLKEHLQASRYKKNEGKAKARAGKARKSDPDV